MWVIDVDARHVLHMIWGWQVSVALSPPLRCYRILSRIQYRTAASSSSVDTGLAVDDCSVRKSYARRRLQATTGYVVIMYVLLSYRVRLACGLNGFVATEPDLAKIKNQHGHCLGVVDLA